MHYVLFKLRQRSDREYEILRELRRSDNLFNTSSAARADTDTDRYTYPTGSRPEKSSDSGYSNAGNIDNTRRCNSDISELFLYQNNPRQ